MIRAFASVPPRALDPCPHAEIAPPPPLTHMHADRCVGMCVRSRLDCACGFTPGLARVTRCAWRVASTQVVGAELASFQYSLKELIQDVAVVDGAHEFEGGVEISGAPAKAKEKKKPKAAGKGAARSASLRRESSLDRLSARCSASVAPGPPTPGSMRSLPVTPAQLGPGGFGADMPPPPPIRGPPSTSDASRATSRWHNTVDSVRSAGAVQGPIQPGAFPPLPIAPPGFSPATPGGAPSTARERWLYALQGARGMAANAHTPAAYQYPTPAPLLRQGTSVANSLGSKPAEKPVVMGRLTGRVAFRPPSLKSPRKKPRATPVVARATDEPDEELEMDYATAEEKVMTSMKAVVHDARGGQQQRRGSCHGGGRRGGLRPPGSRGSIPSSGPRSRRGSGCLVHPSDADAAAMASAMVPEHGAGVGLPSGRHARVRTPATLDAELEDDLEGGEATRWDDEEEEGGEPEGEDEDEAADQEEGGETGTGGGGEGRQMKLLSTAMQEGIPENRETLIYTMAYWVRADGRRHESTRRARARGGTGVQRHAFVASAHGRGPWPAHLPQHVGACVCEPPVPPPPRLTIERSASRPAALVAHRGEGG